MNKFKIGDHVGSQILQISGVIKRDLAPFKGDILWEIEENLTSKNRYAWNSQIEYDQSYINKQKIKNWLNG